MKKTIVAVMSCLLLSCAGDVSRDPVVESPPCESTSDCQEGMICCLDGVCRESCSRDEPEPDEDIYQSEFIDTNEPDISEDAGSEDTYEPDISEDTYEPDSEDSEDAEDAENPDTYEVDSEDTSSEDSEDPDMVIEEWTCAVGLCIDPDTGLMWEQDPLNQPVTYEVAETYCEGSNLGMYTDWRVPTVDELRTLIRGCPKNEPNGTCKLHEWCRAYACFNHPCQGCDAWAGPGEDGYYWPTEFDGPEEYWVNWSSTTGLAEENSEGGHWNVRFHVGGFHIDEGTDEDAVPRCVRDL